MSEHVESPFFRKWAELVLRFRWILLAVTAAITAASVWLIATDLKVDNTTEYFAAGNGDVTAVLEEYRDDFGRDDFYLVLVEGDVFTMDFLERLRALHEDIEALDIEVDSLGERMADRQDVQLESDRPQLEDSKAAEGVDDLDDFGDFGDFGDEDAWGDEEGGTVIEEVTSLVNLRQTVWEDKSLQVRGLLDEWPTEAELPALKQRVLSDPFALGNVVGPEATHTVIAVRAQFMNEDDSAKVNAAIADLADKHEAEGFRTVVTGTPALNAVLNKTVVSEMSRLVGLVALVMGIVLAWLFRRPLGVLAPLAVVGLAALWTLGAMTATGTPVTIVSNILPAFLVCVGMGDSVHIQSVYRDARLAGVDNREAIVRAVASTGMPILFTTMTTMAGLLSFWFASTVAIQEMGLSGAFGVAMALANSIVFLPIALSFRRSSVAERKERSHDVVDRILQLCTAASASPRRMWVTLAGGAVFIGISIAGITQLDVYHNPLVWLGEDHPNTVSILEMDDHIGGTASAEILIETDAESGLKDRDLLLAIEGLEQHAMDFEHPRTGDRIVSSTSSLAGIVKETNRALEKGDPAHYAIPKTQQGVNDALLLFEQAGPDQLSRLATGDLRKSHVTMRVDWMDATSYEPFVAHLQEGIDELVGDTAEVKTTGSIYSVVTVVNSLIGDMMRSFGVAVGLITLMMIFLLRDLRLGLVSMVPNLVPIGFILGFMGFVNIDIDLSNLLIASIVIGIAVDDTIHYLHQFRTAYVATGDVEASIQHALNHAGRALISTSVVLSLGFAVFLASDLISMQRFGVLVGITCIVALFVDLVLTPALLRLLYSDKKTTSTGVRNGKSITA